MKPLFYFQIYLLPNPVFGLQLELTYLFTGGP